MTRRNTSQQRAIGAVIEAAGRPLSIPEINELAAEEVPGLGLRTVYRVVDRLLEDGVIAPVPVAGQPDRYELAEAAARHHHHFHCLNCDRVFDVHGCPGRMDRMVPKGFVLDSHEITLNGWCDQCA